MQKERILFGLLFGVLVLGLANFSSAYADTFTAVQDGNWANPNTWTPFGSPADEDVAIIPNGFTVNATNPVEAGSVINNGILNISNEFGFYTDFSNNTGQINISSTNHEAIIETNFDNFGTITNNGPITFGHLITINNTGTIINNGNLNTNALVITSGIFSNFGSIDNSNEIRNQIGADFTNELGSSFSNFGLLTNFDIFLNNGEMANSGFGVITNDPSGTFTNNNILTFNCDSTINGIITNIQPLDICADNPPVFTSFPTDIVTDTDVGENFAIVSYPFPIAVDGIVPATVTQTAGLTSGSQFPLGVTVNTFEALDADSQSTIMSFTVTVNDVEAPVLSNIPGNITQDNDPGLPSAVVTWIPPTPTATDNVAIASFTSTHNPGDPFPLGTVMVTYTAIDTAGNSASASFDVTVNDAENPVINDISGNITVDNVSGLPSAVVTWTEPTATDNSGSVTLIANATSGDSFPLGVTTVTYTATDAAGNFVTASFDVTVNDAENPVINDISGDITVDNVSGLPSAVVTWTEPTATDNSGSVTLIANATSGDSFPLGVTTVTYTATDAAGNFVTASFDVTVNDAENPVINDISGDIMKSADTGLPSAVVTWTEPTATDNSGSVTLIANATSGDSFPLGVTTVTYTATDAAGNFVTASFDVTVNDAENPVINDIPADIIESLPIGESSVAVFWTEPTATDNGGSVTLIANATSGDLFPLGTTTVTYTATDNDENISTASFDVTVIASIFTAVQDGDWNDPLTWDGQVPPDTDNKLIPAGITVSNSGTFTNFGNIEILGNLTNNCGGFITNSGTVTGLPVQEVLCIPNLVSPSDGSLIHEEKPDLIWEVNATEIRPIIFTANLENATNPGVPIQLVSLSLVSAEPLNKALDGNYAWNVFVDIDSLYDPGYPFVANTVSSSVAIYDVEIIDTIAPVISGIPDDFTVFIPEGNTETQVFWTPPTATDNIDDVFFFSANILPGFTLGLGEHVVTYTARDSSDNESTASFTVTVAIGETEPPQIIGMPDDIVTNLESGEDTIAVFWTEPTATDNVGVTSFTSTHNPGDLFPLGVTTVTYTASDFNGNTTEESFTITVNPSGKFVDPELQDLSNKQIKKFEKYIDKWEHEIEKLEKGNIKLEEKAVKYENKGKQDKADSLREKILSNEAEIEVLEDQISVVQVSIGNIPEQLVEVEVQENLSSKAYKGIEKDIKKWEKKLKYLNYAEDKLEKRAQKYEDKGKLDKAERIRDMVNGINAQINVIEDILEVLVCAIDFEQSNDHKPHHGHDHDNDDDKNGKGHDKHYYKYHND